MNKIKDGYLIDYISGKEVKANPEEVEAVQVFSKILVEDYGYPKENIQTHPQFTLKGAPSDKYYKYPVDIAVFKNKDKKRDEEIIIIECKSKTRQDGISQLHDYLKFSKAKLGVWFNGEETQYVRKYFKNGELCFDNNLINIPKYGQRYEDIGQFKKKDLQPVHNLKAKFVSIRNYLAGNAVGTTRDEELARQIIHLILCKLYDEKYTKDDEMVKFRAGINEDKKEVAQRIKKRFEESKTVYGDVLEVKDSIDLDDKSILYVVGELQNYSFMKAERDVLGDAFEVFIHRALKGGQGQYFTPKNVIKTAIEILDPKINDKIIDPACGSGGFLIEGLKDQHKKIEKKGEEYSWPEDQILEEKISKSNINFRGIEKDQFLSKIVKAYMILMGDGKSGIYCEDSLNNPKDWSSKTRSNIHLGEFDILFANPPFGSKIPVKGKEKLSQFQLGHKWKKNKKDNVWEIDKLKEKEAPQILFIDRCLQLVKENGKLALILPDGILSNPTDGYIVQYILTKAEIIGLIDLPMNTFLPNTPTKTHMIFLKRTDSPRSDYEFFMSYAKTCGHDKRGRKLESDEIREIPSYLKKLDNKKEFSHLGWKMRLSDIKNQILLPKYYNPDIKNELKIYEKTGKYKVKSIGDLVDEGLIEISRGHEVGSINYGTGDIPFVRTSEIANWEIISDVTHCLSEDVYEEYKDKQNIEEEDILIVNDGTYLMGRTAMVTDIDKKMVLQSHIRRIKVIDKERLSPYLLLGLLGMEIVQRQIESKSFRQGTISTLGSRLEEVSIPIPIDENINQKMTEDIKKIIINKRNAKKIAQEYMILNKNENLMGIKNKAKLGNL